MPLSAATVSVLVASDRLANAGERPHSVAMKSQSSRPGSRSVCEYVLTRSRDYRSRGALSFDDRAKPVWPISPVLTK